MAEAETETETKPTPRRWRLAAILAGLGFFLLCFLVIRILPATEPGRTLIASSLEGTKVGQLGWLHVEGLTGDLWGRAGVARLTLRDKDGVWLEARGLSAGWRPAALLGREVHVAYLRVARITVLRRFTPLPTSPPTPSPVSVRLDRISATFETLPAFSVNRGLFLAIGSVRVDRAGAPTGNAHMVSLLRPGDRLDASFALGKRGRFALAAKGREAPGGALAGALGLSPTQDFALDVGASGRGRAGFLELLARSGTRQAARAHGRWSAAGGSTDARIDLAASTLLAPYASLLGPELRLTAAGRPVSRDLYDLAFTARGAKVVVTEHGEVDVAKRRAGPRGLAVTARLDEPWRLVPGASSGPLSVSGGLGGDFKNWSAVGAATLERPDLGLKFTRVTAPFRVTAAGRRIDLGATARGEGAGGMGLVGDLLGANPTAAARVSWLGDGRTVLRQLTVTGAALTVTGSGTQSLLGDLVFKGRIVATNAARLAPGMKGGVTADLNARQSGRKPWMFTVAAKGERFATGSADADRLLGPSPTLSLDGAFDGKALSLTKASLGARAGSATAAGKLGAKGELQLALTWRAAGPITVGPLEIDGAVTGHGDVGGTLASPTADLIADLARLDLPSLPLRDAHLVVRLAAATGGVGAQASVTAASAYGPARASGRLHLAGADLEVSDLDANAGGLGLKGGFDLAAGAPSRADLTWTLGPGAFLEGGHAAGHARIVQAGAEARADIAATGSSLVLRGGTTIRDLRLTATGPLHHLPYHAEASGVVSGTPWRLTGTGVVAPETGLTRVSFSGSGRARGVDMRTLAPAAIAFGSDRLTASADVAAGGGRASLAYSQLGERLDAKATIADVALSAFEPDLAGSVSGQASLAGAGARLGGSFDARLLKATIKGRRGQPPFNGELRGTLAGDRLSLAADLASTGSTARLAALLPVEASAAPFRIAIATRRPLSGTFAIDGEVAPLWDLAVGDEQSLAGRFTASGALAGTLADPRVTGTASLANGRFSDVSTGLKLRDLILQASLNGTVIDVSRLDAKDAAKGELAGSGRLNLTRDGVSTLTLVLKGFRLIDNELGQASASGSVVANRTANGKVRLTGALAIDRAQIAPKVTSNASITPMEVVEIHRKIDPDVVPETRAAPPSPIDLDVTLKAPGGVFIKGRGLNLELSLDAHVTGSTASPSLTGAARVVRGEYDFAGKRFTFAENGVVHLSTAPEAIRLDLTATRDDPTLTAVIRITGTAAKPIVELTSTPALPQDEVLSQVLFGSSVASLNGLQAAQLASALSGLAGGGGLDVIGGIRTLAHLDRLAITSTATGGNTIAGGKYLTDKVYLELSGGEKEGPGAQVEWRVKRHLAIVSRVTQQGEQALSIRWRKDY